MMAAGDLIEFKQGFRAPWRPGYIEQLAAHAIIIRAALGKREAAPSFPLALLHAYSCDRYPSYHVVTSTEQGASAAGVAHV